MSDDPMVEYAAMMLEGAPTCLYQAPDDSFMERAEALRGHAGVTLRKIAIKATNGVGYHPTILFSDVQHALMRPHHRNPWKWWGPTTDRLFCRFMRENGWPVQEG